MQRMAEVTASPLEPLSNIQKTTCVGLILNKHFTYVGLNFIIRKQR